MKKLFTLLAMVGLAFASCTPAGEDDGGQTGPQGGGNEFTIEITDVGEYGATVTITPKDEARTYYWWVTKMAYVNEEGGPAGWMQYVYESNKESVDNGNDAWVDGEDPLLVSGVQTHTFTALNPGTTYCAYAFGIDANGNLTSTELSYKTFTTNESTFDTSVWAGLWNVTTSTVYMEVLLNGETYQAGFADASEEPYTRQVEIIDGAEFDMAGYALVYGWDGAFYGLPSAEAENYFPAVAVYAGNTLELLNEEIVYEQNGIIFQWYSVWDCAGDSYLVRGEYAAYKFKMEQDGSVSVNGYQGTLQGGLPGYVVLFQILDMGPDENGEPSGIPAYAYTEDCANGLPVIHFAGNTMTAAKVVVDNGGAEPAPAKLSAKKNLKVMHKYANAKSAAMQFSSAVKMAKLAK